jgi:hypothetical protein
MILSFYFIIMFSENFKYCRFLFLLCIEFLVLSKKINNFYTNNSFIHDIMISVDYYLEIGHHLLKVNSVYY